MSQPLLAETNSLSLLQSGIWVKADEQERSFIDYTDGDNTENQVYAKVKAAQDRSVFSEEMDQPWADWALEYHLCSRRSNIYRGLNLEGVRTVLEVGCGCGAISRFLGEQGFLVDAIEGTQRRAEIARLRTADLENVQIICSNYHELSLPVASYDLVVFTGVLEYSGAYAPPGVSPEQQLAETLRLARAAMSENGQILVAIENRTGFKYLAGAGEDHLNIANIGLNEYIEPLSAPITRGIRTWSKQQWCEMLDDMELGEYEFCYPFADYKVPDAIVSEHFLQNAHHPEQVLGGVASRDYVARWMPRLREGLFWRTAAQTRTMDKFANSFLIVIAGSSARLRQTIDFDFVRFASTLRKRAYRLQVVKKRDEDVVRRFPLVPDIEGGQGVVRQHHIESERFIDGQMLEQVWRQAIEIVPSYEELAAHIRLYWRWLIQELANGADAYVDALPGNIVLDEDGRWHLIDQEWHAVNGVSQEIVLFRALFHFVLKSGDLFERLNLEAVRKDIDTRAEALQFPLILCAEDFVRWGFGVCEVDYEFCRENCIDFEASLHKQVSRPDYVSDMKGALSRLIHQEDTGQVIDVRVFWTRIDHRWHEDHSVSMQAVCSPGIEFDLELPAMVSKHRFLRIDLSTDILAIFRESMTLQSLAITVARESGVVEQVFRVDSAVALFARARIDGMRLLGGDTLRLISPGVSMVLDLHDIDWGESVLALKMNFCLENTSEINTTRERQWLTEQSRRAAQRIRFRQHILSRQQQTIENNSQRLLELETKINRSSTTALGRLLARFGLMRKFTV